MRASKVEAPDPTAPPGAYIRVGDSVLTADRAVGSANTPQLDASWKLEFHGSAEPVRHLPRWAYRAPLPRTKLLSPHPEVTFTGTVHAGGRRLELDGWPGTIGHNWGSEHAWRTIWIHGAGFEDHADAWLELALARVKVGRLTTPWVANGVLCLDGHRHRLGGIERVRSTTVDEAVERCRFKLPGEGIQVSGIVAAPRRDFVGWLYAQPQGGERQTINSSIADLDLEVARGGGETVTLHLARAAAYELQMQERYPAIPVQPFPAG